MANQIYAARSDPMRVFVLFSGGASAYDAILGDKNNDMLYKVVGAGTNRKAPKGEEKFRKTLSDRPVVKMLYREFCEGRCLDFASEDARRAYYEEWCRRLIPFQPDVIILSGYMHIVTDPLLAKYRNRILNVHPADISILSGGTVSRLDVSNLSPREAKALAGRNRLSRKIKGENAVYDAIVFGENETRSTVHIATENYDEGPIVVQSTPFAIDEDVRRKVAKGELDGLQKYADDLQNRMKIEGDGPAYLKALEFLSQGRLSIDEETLLLDGIPLPYCGFRLGET